jgi:hypothetical protein
MAGILPRAPEKKDLLAVLRPLAHEEGEGEGEGEGFRPGLIHGSLVSLPDRTKKPSSRVGKRALSASEGRQ